MTPITLAHGNGGRLMRQLIEQVFARHLYSELAQSQCDAAPLSLPAGELMLSTDTFTVKPLAFPGGDIGSLAIHGTVNDLAVSGATPHALALNVIIEEGFALEQLERLVISMAQAAKACGVRIVAGDTKVVARGEGGGLYLATTGIGCKPAGLQLGLAHIRSGDRLLISGPVGDHGAAVMLAREDFGLQGELLSDAASVLPLTQALISLPGLRFMRDPTRGGLATVAHEIAHACGLSIQLEQDRIPLRPQVATVCEILGYDPLYLACEGRVLAVVAAEQAGQALQRWRELAQGEQAAIIGEVGTDCAPALVSLRTPLGGERILPELEQEALPRIC